VRVKSGSESKWATLTLSRPFSRPNSFYYIILTCI